VPIIPPGGVLAPNAETAMCSPTCRVDDQGWLGVSHAA
jgi:hypothetical protein